MLGAGDGRRHGRAGANRRGGAYGRGRGDWNGGRYRKPGFGGRYRVRAWQQPSLAVTAPQIFYLGGTESYAFLSMKLQIINSDFILLNYCSPRARSNQKYTKDYLNGGAH